MTDTNSTQMEWFKEGAANQGSFVGARMKYGRVSEEWAKEMLFARTLAFNLETKKCVQFGPRGAETLLRRPLNCGTQPGHGTEVVGGGVLFEKG